MTSSNGQVADVVEGIVESANERGIKVGGEWRNASKFHPIDLPERGARVRLELDSKGFIRTLEVLSSPELKTVGISGRDRTITRLSVLKTAAVFGASRPDLKSSDVLAIAQRWLEWVVEAES